MQNMSMKHQYMVFWAAVAAAFIWKNTWCYSGLILGSDWCLTPKKGARYAPRLVMSSNWALFAKQPIL